MRWSYRLCLICARELSGFSLNMSVNLREARTCISPLTIDHLFCDGPAESESANCSFLSFRYRSLIPVSKKTSFVMSPFSSLKWYSPTTFSPRGPNSILTGACWSNSASTALVNSGAASIAFLNSGCFSSFWAALLYTVGGLAANPHTVIRRSGRRCFIT
jgi:hypothetical protein